MTSRLAGGAEAFGGLGGVVAVLPGGIVLDVLRWPCSAIMRLRPASSTG